jgi:hypothetical protein
LCEFAAFDLAQSDQQLAFRSPDVKDVPHPTQKQTDSLSGLQLTGFTAVVNWVLEA